MPEQLEQRLEELKELKEKTNRKIRRTLITALGSPLFLGFGSLIAGASYSPEKPEAPENYVRAQVSLKVLDEEINSLGEAPINVPYPPKIFNPEPILEAHSNYNTQLREMRESIEEEVKEIEDSREFREYQASQQNYESKISNGNKFSVYGVLAGVTVAFLSILRGFYLESKRSKITQEISAEERRQWGDGLQDFGYPR